MSRKPMIAGNWKMNKTLPESVILAQDIANATEKDWLDSVDVVVCPTYVNLKAVWTVFDFEKMNVHVGAQNVYPKNSGAYTGETSVDMIKEAGCDHCIIGHSERREYFEESDEFVNEKAKALIAKGLISIICCGESLDVRDNGDAKIFVCEQIQAAYAGISSNDALKTVVAYEPIWAIGTGRTATPEYAEEICSIIRAKLAEIYSKDVAQQIRILYGGSMKPENVDSLIKKENIDGGLIGGASLNADDFLALIKACI
ncbi:MAG: triose-phosphate isomerase [Eggerthellaceae bacterium]|nr:triose-phosphate isomerase [Eggerthellaceae bacterium]